MTEGRGFAHPAHLDLVYLFGFYLRREQTSEAIAVCRRASEELPLLDDEEGSGETARDQMRMVWRNLEEEVKQGKVDLGATTVLRNYIKAHWRNPSERAAVCPEVRAAVHTRPGTVDGDLREADSRFRATHSEV